MEPQQHADQHNPAPKGSIGNQLKQYLFLKKRDRAEPRDVNVRMMHGMNRISIIIFLIAIVILIARALFRH